MHASDWSEYDLPARLRSARRRAGLSQQELAKQMGTRQDSISRAESTVVPREPLRSKLAAFVNRSEAKVGNLTNDVVESIARSPELKALIERIASQVNA